MVQPENKVVNKISESFDDNDSHVQGLESTSFPPGIYDMKNKYLYIYMIMNNDININK